MGKETTNSTSKEQWNSLSGCSRVSSFRVFRGVDIGCCWASGLLGFKRVEVFCFSRAFEVWDFGSSDSCV